MCRVVDGLQVVATFEDGGTTAVAVIARNIKERMRHRPEAALGHLHAAEWVTQMRIEAGRDENKLRIILPRDGLDDLLERLTVFRVAEAGGRFIAPNATETSQILAKHPFLKPLTVPAGSYPGQAAAIPSVGSWSFILARPDLPDDTGYRLAKALHEGEARLRAKLDQAKETTAANTAAAAPDAALIQPGVAKYLREIGVL